MWQTAKKEDNFQRDTNLHKISDERKPAYASVTSL